MSWEKFASAKSHSGVRCQQKLFSLAALINSDVPGVWYFDCRASSVIAAPENAHQLYIFSHPELERSACAVDARARSMAAQSILG
jgi:hypothetical protein